MSIYDKTQELAMHAQTPPHTLAKIQSFHSARNGVAVHSKRVDGRVALVFTANVRSTLLCVLYADILLTLSDAEIGQFIVEIMAANENDQRMLMRITNHLEYAQALRSNTPDAKSSKEIFMHFPPAANAKPVITKL